MVGSGVQTATTPVLLRQPHQSQHVAMRGSRNTGTNSNANNVAPNHDHGTNRPDPTHWTEPRLRHGLHHRNVHDAGLNHAAVAIRLNPTTPPITSPTASAPATTMVQLRCQLRDSHVTNQRDLTTPPTASSTTSARRLLHHHLRRSRQSPQRTRRHPRSNHGVATRPRRRHPP